MEIIINDISFMLTFYEEETMMQAVHLFVNICKMLESDRCHSVTALVRDDIEMSWPIGVKCNIYGLVQKIRDRTERSYFLSLITGLGKIKKTAADPFIYKGKLSYACAMAVETGMLVSLGSDEGFLGTVITGKIRDTEVKVNNISQEEHLNYYREKLGIRIYEANAEKHKREGKNFYGKGRVASPMDLNDEESQELLDKAIWIKNRLYARKGVHNYAFQETREGIFHCYIDDDLGDDILRELYKKKWD